MPDSIEAKVKNIKMLLLDVDGVMTDGNIIFGHDGEAYKNFNAQDGFGIKIAQRCDIKVGIITGRKSQIVTNRANELQLDETYQGYFRKLEAYSEILAKNNLEEKNVAFIGDDLFDLPVLRRVGFSVAVANAREEVKQEVDYVTELSGGNGAVREVVDLILKIQNKWNDLIKIVVENDN